MKIPVIMGQKVTKNGGGDGIDKKSEKTGIKGWKMGVGVWKLVKRCKMVKEIRWKKKKCEKVKIAENTGKKQ